MHVTDAVWTLVVSVCVAMGMVVAIKLIQMYWIRSNNEKDN